MNNQEYKKLVDEKAPKSKCLQNFYYAFVIGGLICVLGEFIHNLLPFDEKTCSTITSIILIFLGSLLTALGVYDKIAKKAGGGTLVPITGFANAIVAPAMEYHTEGQILGTGAKMFTIAGPVIVFGIISSIIAGIVSMFL